MGNFGTLVRQRRKSLHLKVKDLASQAQVHPTYITYIEKHDRLPSLEVVDKLERLLGIELKQAYTAEKHPTVYSFSYTSLHVSLKDRLSFLPEGKEPQELLKSGLAAFLSAPKKEQNAHDTAFRLLGKLSPEPTKDAALVKTFTQKITALKNAHSKFQYTQAGIIKDLIKSLPVEMKNPHQHTPDTGLKD
ncbi:MAG: helix-turn-helix domain-containing protein [Candidatus Omnitrophota bacterium]